MLRRPPEPVKASSLTRTGSSLISSPRGGPLKPSFGLSGAVLRLKRSSCVEESGGHPGNVLSVPARVVRFTPSAPLGCRNIFHIDIGQAGNDTSVGISSMSSCLGTLLVALLTLSAGASDALAGQFKKAAYYRAGQQPRHVVAGHLTASGNLDLVFADYLSNQVVTLLGMVTELSRSQSSLPPPPRLASPSGILTRTATWIWLWWRRMVPGTARLRSFLATVKAASSYPRAIRLGSNP
jgi:hypothetical protein